MAGECAACPYAQSRPSAGIRGERWSAYHGDSLMVLRDLSARQPQSVDAIITDPPYGTGANSIAGRLASPLTKYRSSNVRSHLPSFAGDSMLPDQWAEMMHQVMALCMTLAKPGASALVFCDWRGYPTLMRIMGATGWGLRGCLVWDKGRAARPSPNGFRSQSELIIWARNGGSPDRSPPVYLDGVFRHPTPPRKHHAVEKPLGLMRDLVQICPPGGTVLDPFQGSGTTGVAALMEGLRYIGIEAVEHYHRVACERLAQAEDGAS